MVVAGEPCDCCADREWARVTVSRFFRPSDHPAEGNVSGKQIRPDDRATNLECGGRAKRRRRFG